MNHEIANLGIESQVQQLENIADPATRALATNLLGSVLQLHEAGLERVLSIIEERDSDGAIMSAFRCDPLIRALLMLHNLNDEPPGLRVRQALDQLAPELERAAASATVDHLDDSSARISVRLHGDACGSTGETVRMRVERTMIEAAPDMKEIRVVLEEAKPASVLIPVTAIQPAAQQAEAAPAGRHE